MVQSVELVLDDSLDRLVRQEWQLLLDAGLPSQARHTGPSNAPHVTLGVADEVTAAAEGALRDVDYGLGRSLLLGGLLVFPGRTAVVSRLVVPSQSLLQAHRQVQAALGTVPGRPEVTGPDRWTPHVTLARRLDPDQLAAAMALLTERPRELAGAVRAARRWDGDARATWDIAATA